MHHTGKSIPLPADFSHAVRKRPALHFGTREHAIPRMISDGLHSILNRELQIYPGTLTVSLGLKKHSIYLNGPKLSRFDYNAFVKALINWFQELNKDGRKEKVKTPQEIANFYSWSSLIAIAQASNHFKIFQQRRSTESILTIDGNILHLDTNKVNKGANTVLIEFSPDEKTFGMIDKNDCYSVAGKLRDLAMLCPGLTTILLLPDKKEFRFYFEEGINSALYAEDYYRWPIYGGLLQTKGATDGMSFECAIRFLHAGVHQIKSYVNFHPSQGGTHLKGIGRAIAELFPEDWGCRQLGVMVNPDSGETINLAHSVIGIVHLRTDSPKFAGPTKDVLINEEVEEFVYQTAKLQFAEQWPTMQSHRPR